MSVRKRTMHVNTWLEKYFMAEAVEKLDVSSRLSERSAQERFEKQRIMKDSAGKHIWKEEAWRGNDFFKITTVLCLGEKMFMGGWPNRQFQKKK